MNRSHVLVCLLLGFLAAHIVGVMCAPGIPNSPMTTTGVATPGSDFRGWAIYEIPTSTTMSGYAYQDSLFRSADIHWADHDGPRPIGEIQVVSFGFPLHSHTCVYMCLLEVGEIDVQLRYPLSRNMRKDAAEHAVRTSVLPLQMTMNGIFYGLLIAGTWLVFKRLVVYFTRRGNGTTCAKCGYALQGLRSSVCPECGHTFVNATLNRS